MQRTYSQPWQDYQLMDAGNGTKLERWGKIITIRPDRNAYFSPQLSEKEWLDRAHFKFIEQSKRSGSWQSLKPNIETNWQISYKNININLQLTQFKHLGLFPEQRVNWDIIAQRISKGERFLNLFAYTGVASLVAREKGAKVYHCDSVKKVISWSKKNMLSSGLNDIHWVHEDALKFAKREVKRGKKYKGIVMDPPAYGIGANKERWKIENKFSELLNFALQLKAEDGFIIVNTYSPKLDSAQIIQIATQLLGSEKLDVSTLCVRSESGKILEYGQRTLITN